MSKSALFKQVGRLTFLLSTACFSLLCGVALFLVQSHPDSERVAAAVKVGLVLGGVFWIRSLERRLMDAGLPRWSFWPYFLAVFVACAGLRARGILDVQEMAVFFFVVQIPTVLFPSKPVSAGYSQRGAIQADAQGRLYPEYNGPVGRFQFLLRVLLIAVLFAALLQLARGAGQGIETWEMRLGIVLFAFVWIYSVEGRVMDAGLPRWLSIVYCLILPGVCVLPRFLNIISLHVALALFVVLQIPTILFRSRTVYAGPVGLNDSGQEAHGLRVVGKDKPVRHGVRLDGIEFAVYTLLIAGLWYVLHLLRGDAGFGTMSLAVCLALDAGSLFLGILWSLCVSGRLRDAGLHDWTVESCLVVFAASVLPLAFGVIKFPVALVVFAALQAPAVFIRHGSVSAKFSSG